MKAIGGPQATGVVRGIRGTGRGRTVAALVSVGLLACMHAASGKDAKQPETGPDYTKGEKPAKTDCPWNLGPIGAFGNIWGTKGGTPTRDTRMIQIHSVTEGTPADGVLQAGDVILGVVSPTVDGVRETDARFARDCRHVLADAITEAEKTENGGILKLKVFRIPEITAERRDVLLQRAGQNKIEDLLDGAASSGNLDGEPASGLAGDLADKQKVAELAWTLGVVMDVELRLPAKGGFSDTTPYECEKTRAVVDAAAQAIVTRGLFQTGRSGTKSAKGHVWSFTDALGLLATGEETYMSVIREYARAIARESEEYDIYGDKGIGSWHGGYRNLFLTEYYLATKDTSVLPGITALSTYLALGQSGVGTWSHGMAPVEQNGLYGPPGAYGAMNSCSVVCAMSLLLAQKCEISKKPIDDAVVRSLDFYRWYVDKGCVPYGDHSPAPYHDNNGKNSMTAVLFDLAGERKPADFFTRMTLASYNGRERGHTGHFFSWQWGALGAARGGPAAAQSFAQNTRWFTELERRSDGGCVYQFQIVGDPHKYKDWSTTGCRLLQHCLPRKAIYITGKGGGCLPPITGEDLNATVAAATYDPSELSVKELLADLGSWSPIVRKQAAMALGERDEDVVRELIAMLDSPDRYTRYGACLGLSYAGRKSTDAVNALVDKVEKDEDLTMRYFAVIALEKRGGRDNKNGLGDAVVTATDALLKQAAIYEPEQDPMRKLHSHIAGILFYSGRVRDYKGYFPGGKGIETLDRSLLIPAVKSWLKNPNGGARSEVSSIYPHLKEADLERLWGDIYHATKEKAPSGVMFAGAARANGTIVLAQNGFKEGLPLALDYLYLEGWGKFGRVPAAFEALSSYGAAVKPYLEEMRTREYERYVKGRKPGEVKQCEAAWQKILDNLGRDVELRSIAPYLEAERNR